MVNFCLTNEEKSLLKSLIGKKITSIRHDPFNKFDGDTVYGKVELFFEDLIILINYDYESFPIFGGDDEHPKFSVKTITENEAVSALKDTAQINVLYGDKIQTITLVEDYYSAEWDSKKDTAQIMKAIIFGFGDREMAIQGDYMIPLLDIIKGENLKDTLTSGEEEFDCEEVKFEMKRLYFAL